MPSEEELRELIPPDMIPCPMYFFCETVFHKNAIDLLHDHGHDHSIITCRHCYDSEFPNMTVFVNHLLEHTSIYPLRCRRCDRTFRRWKEIRRHLSHNHSNEDVNEEKDIIDETDYRQIIFASRILKH